MRAVTQQITPSDFAGSNGSPQTNGERSPGLAAKKQFAEMNQHYIHHNAVLPPDAPGQRTRNINDDRAPYTRKDPYANMPMKPNQISMGMEIENSQLQKQPSPAGILTHLRKSSPTGHNSVDERSQRAPRDIGGNQSPGRVVANVMMSGEYKPDFGQIQKVMPN